MPGSYVNLICSFISSVWFPFASKGEKSKAKADKVLENNEIISASKRITTLELKELNERQRAEHAQKMYEQIRNSLRQVEERNTELESKIAEVCLLKKIAENYCILHLRFPAAWITFDKASRGQELCSLFQVKPDVICI